MTKHPEPGTKVTLNLRYANGIVSIYKGKWDGEQWLIRVPYSVDDYELVKDVELLGWTNL